MMKVIFVQAAFMFLIAGNVSASTINQISKTSCKDSIKSINDIATSECAKEGKTYKRIASKWILTGPAICPKFDRTPPSLVFGKKIKNTLAYTCVDKDLSEEFKCADIVSNYNLTFEEKIQLCDELL